LPIDYGKSQCIFVIKFTIKFDFNCLKKKLEEEEKEEEEVFVSIFEIRFTKTSKTNINNNI
jgi:hypothetical protein